jgi:hypothetical protein
MTLEEMTNRELLNLYVREFVKAQDVAYIIEIREELLSRMGGKEGA